MHILDKPLDLPEQGADKVLSGASKVGRRDRGHAKNPVFSQFLLSDGTPLITSKSVCQQPVRRWIIENDWLEAVVALPLNMFYNTGIATYIWVVSNRKPKKRKGKVQLIDATEWYKPLRKNMGQKNCELSPQDIERICDTYLGFNETDHSK